jgi:cytochrome c biogenesis protein CcmG, thiol:disulfide interchange protein DsbE
MPPLDCLLSSADTLGQELFIMPLSSVARPLLVVLLVSGCASMTAGGGAAGGSSGPMAGVGEAMPELSMDGFWERKEVRLSAHRGKVVLLDIWASWCVPCKDELPVLDDLARKLRGQGVEIIAVSIDEDRGAAEQFLKRRPRWSLTLAHDPTGTIPDRLQPPKMPTSYLIDRQGILRHVNAGFDSGDGPRLEAQLRALASAK